MTALTNLLLAMTVVQLIVTLVIVVFFLGFILYLGMAAANKLFPSVSRRDIFYHGKDETQEED